MKRLHLHVSVDSIEASLPYYNALFGCEPCVLKPDYAKWLLDEPCVNFAISARGAAPGLDHLGIQVDSSAELDALQHQLAAADIATQAQNGACCYAESAKHWSRDPAGIAWEVYHTMAEAQTFGDGAADGACCVPELPATAAAPAKPRIKLGSCAPGSGCC